MRKALGALAGEAAEGLRGSITELLSRTSLSALNPGVYREGQRLGSVVFCLRGSLFPALTWLPPKAPGPQGSRAAVHMPRVCTWGWSGPRRCWRAVPTLQPGPAAAACTPGPLELLESCPALRRRRSSNAIAFCFFNTKEPFPSPLARPPCALEQPPPPFPARRTHRHAGLSGQRNCGSGQPLG